MLWFSHFSMDGMSSFKYGAKALAHYVLMHRDVVSFEARHGPGHGPWAVLGYEEGGALLLHALRVMKAGEGLVPQPRVCSCTGCPGRLLQVWQLLVWEGKHAQAPVSVATKTHYFCELDVVRSVRAFLRHCPDFWRSDLFLDALVAQGELLQLEPAWFAKAGMGWLAEHVKTPAIVVADTILLLVCAVSWHPCTPAREDPCRSASWKGRTHNVCCLCWHQCTTSWCAPVPIPEPRPPCQWPLPIPLRPALAACCLDCCCLLGPSPM